MNLYNEIYTNESCKNKVPFYYYSNGDITLQYEILLLQPAIFTAKMPAISKTIEQEPEPERRKKKE